MTNKGEYSERERQTEKKREMFSSSFFGSSSMVSDEYNQKSMVSLGGCSRMPGDISRTAEWPAGVKGQSQKGSPIVATPSHSPHPLTAHHPRTALLLLLCFHPGQREDQEGSSGCGVQDLHKTQILSTQRTCTLQRVQRH